MKGILLIDKPAGWTSFDVVNYVRKTARQAALVESYKVASEKSKKPLNFKDFRLSTPLPKVKVGHSGTLDPFATGLLILLIGKEYTKRASEFSKLDKTYEVTMKLGETSSTGDPEGEIILYRHPERSDSEVEGSRKPSAKTTRSLASARDDMEKTQDYKIPSKTEAKAILKRFTGEIQQVPPAYSAIKIDGKRAYRLAREGKEVKIEPRKVTINRLELVDYSYPEVKFVANVSSGTYIRSLVEDIGKALGTCAYTVGLRRIQIDKYSVSDATDIKSLTTSNINGSIIEL